MKILIIEDDAEFSRQIRTYLEGEEYRCEQADTYESALDKLSFYQYDCILLNPMLPGGDGIRLLTYLRERQLSAGLIVISTEDLLDDKILWLRIGADDYMARPFHLSELSARIYSIIRRRQFQNNNMIAFKEMKMDLLAKSLYVRDKPVTLTKKEFDLIRMFLGNKGKLISKSALAEHLSGDRADMLDNQDFVYTHLKNLKKKLTEAGAGNYIKTVYGAGYKWEDDQVS